MYTKTIRLALVVLSAMAVAMLSGTRLNLADDDGGSFDFELDPLLLEMLFTDVDTSSSKFEEYRDMDNDALVRRLRLYGESSDHNRVMDLHVLNAGRADARYTLHYGLSGRYSLTLDHNVIPHRFGNDGILLHSTANGPGMLQISDTTQQTLQDAVEAQFLLDPTGIGLDFLRDQLQPFIDTANIVDLGLERRRSRAKLDISKMSKLAWSIDLKQETRTGSRPYGASFGFNNAIELPEPIEYNTRSAEFAGEWTGERAGVRFGVRTSRFSNQIDTLTYDNPWRITDSTDSRAYLAPSGGAFAAIGGPSVGQNALSPDSSSTDLFVMGHSRLGRQGWINASAGYARMEQSEPLLPYTVNTAINEFAAAAPAPFDASDPANLPVTNADTEVGVLTFSANAGTKIGKKASIKFRLRYYDYDNKSAMVPIPGYVRFDAVWEDIPRITVPYGYTRERAGVEFGYDVSDRTHLGIGYDRESWDREFREIDSADEDIFRFFVDTRASKRVTLRGSLEHGDRSTSEYSTEAQLFSFLDPDEEINNLPGLRKYDEAEREYDQARVSALIMANDAVSVTLGASMRDEEYGGPAEFGLLSDEVISYNAEIGYTPHERLSLFVFGHRSDRESFQRARQSGGTLSTSPLDDWELTLGEVTDSFGLGIDGRLSERWTAHVQAHVSKSDGDSDFFSPPGGSPDLAESFDEYDDNEWKVYSARVAVKASEHLKAGISIGREEYTTNRFARDGLVPYLPGTLILNPLDGDYDADILVVDLKISF